MEIAFKNQELQNLLSIEGKGLGDFDILGRISLVQRNIEKLKEMNTILNSSFQNGIYRQKILQKGLESTLNKVVIENMLLDTPLMQKGRFDNIFLYSNSSIPLVWENIDISTSSDGVTVKNINILYEVLEDTIYCQQLPEEYCIVKLRLAPGITARALSVYKNFSDIKSIKIKSASSEEWQELSPAESVIEKQGIIFGEGYFTEAKIVIKNTLINNFYYLDLKAIPIAKKIEKDFITIKWEKAIPINGLYAFPYNGVPFFGNVSLYIGEKLYSTQIPVGAIFDNQISKLIKETSDTYSYTIGKCPYPISLTELPILSQEIENLNENSNLKIADWQFSFDKVTWYPKSMFTGSIYPEITIYNSIPRYLYFKTNGYYENIYISYRKEKNINCAWPLSEDGIIFYDGNGISIKNTNNLPVSFEINFIFSNESLEFLQKEFPVGFIGVD